MATESMGEDKMQEVKAFFKAVREGETEGLVDEDEQDAMEAMKRRVQESTILR